MKKGIAFIVVLGMLLCGCSAGQNNNQTSKTEISVQSQVSEESKKEESKKAGIRYWVNNENFRTDIGGVGSLNEFIRRAIRETMERDKQKNR